MIYNYELSFLQNWGGHLIVDGTTVASYLHTAVVIAER